MTLENAIGPLKNAREYWDYKATYDFVSSLGYSAVGTICVLTAAKLMGVGVSEIVPSTNYTIGLFSGGLGGGLIVNGIMLGIKSALAKHEASKLELHIEEELNRQYETRPRQQQKS